MPLRVHHVVQTKIYNSLLDNVGDVNVRDVHLNQ